MLKHKLTGKKNCQNPICKDSAKKACIRTCGTTVTTINTSKYFVTAFWKHFYDLECKLNEDLKSFKPTNNITYIYNPIEYAAVLHVQYLRAFLDGPKKVMFVGMNPGPNGMGQTGVPFGNIMTVAQSMNLTGQVQQPEQVHPKRPVTGLLCTIEEPSGVRMWTLLQRLAGGSLSTFSKQCFVHNFCPLMFFDKDGKSLTPNELKGEYKSQIRDQCLNTLDQLVSLLDPEIIIAVGDYVYTALKKSQHYGFKTVLKLPHPSPRSLNNQNWPEKAEHFLNENSILKFIRNEI